MSYHETSYHVIFLQLGGVVIPNDGLCHLDGEEYSASLLMVGRESW